jgi:hypothetical protein
MIDAAEASFRDKPKKVEPPFADNYTPGSKSKVSDYAPSAEAVILQAACHYECKVLAEEAFPQVTVHLEWVKETFKRPINFLRRTSRLQIVSSPW